MQAVANPYARGGVVKPGIEVVFIGGPWHGLRKELIRPLWDAIAVPVTPTVKFIGNLSGPEMTFTKVVYQRRTCPTRGLTYYYSSEPSTP